MDTIEALEQHMEEAIISGLREVFPYMKIATVHTIAEKCKALLVDEVEFQMPGMEQTKDRINFMSLAPELRNRIYGLALHHGLDANSTTIYICRRGADDPVACSDFYRDKGAEQPALTRVSRQVRCETLPIYYGSNQFLIYSEHGPRFFEGPSPDTRRKYGSKVAYSIAEKWLKAIGPNNVCLLKDILVHQSGHPDAEIDWCPATRFVGQIARSGIKLPEGSVTGFGWERTKWYFSRVSREVDEADIPSCEDLDVLWDICRVDGSEMGYVVKFVDRGRNEDEKYHVV